MKMIAIKQACASKLAGEKIFLPKFLPISPHEYLKIKSTNFNLTVRNGGKSPQISPFLPSYS